MQAVASLEACWDVFQQPSVWKIGCCHPLQGSRVAGTAVRAESCFNDDFRSAVCCRYFDGAIEEMRSKPCLRGCTEQAFHTLAGNVSRFFQTECLLVRLVRAYHQFLRYVTYAPHPAAINPLWRRLLVLLDVCHDVPDVVMWEAVHLTASTIRFGMRSVLQVTRAGRSISVSNVVQTPLSQFARSNPRLQPLALDVGCAGGLTSRHFLEEGYRVVAVEPNPRAVNALLHRFTGPIGDGALTVLPVAIRKRGEATRLTFFADQQKPQSSQLDDLLTEGEKRRTGTRINVTALTCGQIVRNLSRRIDVATIDAEGRSLECAVELCRLSKSRSSAADDPGLPPRYMAIEVTDVKGDLLMLQSCGYTGFKLVRQARFYIHVSEAIHDNSYGSKMAVLQRATEWNRDRLIAAVGESGAGPIGEHSLDWVVGPRWRRASEVLTDYEMLQNSEALRGLIWREMIIQSTGDTYTDSEWFDIHAVHSVQ